MVKDRVPVILPVVDDPPKTGVWVDPEEWEVTDEEVAAGNALGERTAIAGTGAG